MTIHWCGTGLSAIPGLRRLLEAGHDVAVWNRTPDKAREAIGDLTSNIRSFSLANLGQMLSPKDVIVSMLPGDWHVPLAELAIEHGAHFVSSSYIAPDMRALDQKAKDAGVCLINEVGLDPGIDHLMAHALVADYKASDAFDAANEISFISYCGGIPKTPNPFRYKFSWSPLGVLKALRSPSKSIRDFKALDVARPWDAISSYAAPLPTPESFEVYPNRDSLPFMAQYEFGDDWNVKDFVRGTLRLNGWAEAWADVFKEVETLEGAEGDARLKDMSDQFWTENAYAEGEADRVVLCVGLKAERDGSEVWHKTYVMDAWGDERGTAMARLVSYPVSFAIEAAMNSKITPGVSAAPSDPALVDQWMAKIGELAQHLEVVDNKA
ncbi:saccharopine dehydrogenase family protein [Phaeobacter gallaeciensis]|uniref:Saccharopine dehydrogenase (NADP+, L-glutamate-forming) n=1 Tax=Phaeobacter gallaeciensis TaxID=60890 RepID=A0AAC9ZBP3_9RHOB|nr:saccharopine dehydrogenase family protein [Phaeobacter gallaeciensis]AHD11050.1 Saccharopine dehydrogenase [Phaeobacter gallaeciensis DSM 26640]ATE94313.1 putative saccharopine dehydrogenase (NADP+, L-glutamate-forming) [Phaeobacter gallaeciensis]ATE98586.1 putative saccharopine dehydrogenase (NADP+, L-glutamate-forming) [Phaeobacter gallaeciensis]ATF02977.1 putative saccharopine dehydrogenase (NADP+, L-glutamate-forming) [Phaeobacter gallaeciensis]ATF07357.1 putative saccharopine dehydroge